MKILYLGLWWIAAITASDLPPLLPSSFSPCNSLQASKSPLFQNRPQLLSIINSNTLHMINTMLQIEQRIVEQLSPSRAHLDRHATLLRLPCYKNQRS